MIDHLHDVVSEILGRGEVLDEDSRVWMWEVVLDVGGAKVYRYRTNLESSPQLLSNIVLADSILHGDHILVFGQQIKIIPVKDFFYCLIVNKL